MLTKAWLLFNEIKQGISFFTGSLLFDPLSHFFGDYYLAAEEFMKQKISFLIYSIPLLVNEFFAPGGVDHMYETLTILF